MKINYKKAKKVSIIIFKYLTIGLIVASSFFLGRYNGKTSYEPEVIESFKTVNRSEVNIAVDERNNLIIIDIESGNYTIFEDSIGQSIFKVYAKKIWSDSND